MKKTILTGLAAIMTLLLASVALAAEGDVQAAAASDKILITACSVLAAGVGVGLAALGGGIGQGIAVNGTVLGTARNPEMSGKLMTLLLIGLALIESLVIYALVIALILLYANPYL
jgi:F-type H+-transporting ATPase subunit c